MDRAANSEQRERTRLINKENRALAAIAAIEKEFASCFYHDIEFTAYHEAGHAVLHEVLSNGVNYATIVPNKKDDKQGSLGHVQPAGTLPISQRQRVLVEVACLLAGGLAAQEAGDEDWDWG